MQKWKDGTIQMSFIRLLPNFHFYHNYPEPDVCNFQTGLYLLKKNAAGEYGIYPIFSGKFQ